MYGNILMNLATLWKVLRVTTFASGSAKMWLKLYMSSGDHNFTVLSRLSSIDMYYELNATIIVDFWNNIHT